MKRLLWIAMLGWWLWWLGRATAYAESRPIKQLPSDLARWSTMWVAVPEEMYHVGHDYGPIAGLTWGPAKGAAKMVEFTTKEVWSALKVDEKEKRRRGQYARTGGPKGPIFRYEF